MVYLISILDTLIVQVDKHEAWACENIRAPTQSMTRHATVTDRVYLTEGCAHSVAPHSFFTSQCFGIYENDDIATETARVMLGKHDERQ